jgi:hypothetical protein
MSAGMKRFALLVTLLLAANATVRATQPDEFIAS